MNREVVFILSSWRAGSTLLQRILNAHSRIVGLTSGCPESTRETDDIATPARSATSRMLDRPRGIVDM